MKKILISIISWVAAFDLLMIFRYFDQNLSAGSMQTQIIGATTSGIVVGILFSLVDTYFNRDWVKRKSFTYVIAIKSLVFIVAIIMAIVATVITVEVANGNSSLAHFQFVLAGAFSSSTTLVYTFYTLLISILFYYNKQIHKKIGPEVLRNLLLGKYHRPREEERIFMFLDLASATSIAEKLDSFTYSSFLHDFFYDLDEVIQKTKGTAFQFVGDEVVIVWKVKDGILNNNCIQFFFMAEKKMMEEEAKYLDKYGVVPEFKAGIHYGKIVITEVGGSKQEIAYHGDTINTAARIRSECNNTDQKMLISAELLSILSHLDEGFTIETKGVFSLKGKKNVVGLVAVKEKGEEEQVETSENEKKILEFEQQTQPAN